MPPWLPLVVGIASLTVFVLRQIRLGDGALLDMRAFRTPAFSLAVALVSVSMMSLFGTSSCCRSTCRTCWVSRR